MEEEKKKKDKPNKFWLIINIFFVSVTLILFSMLAYSDIIGDKLAKENYDYPEEKGEWLWNVWIFIAIVMGFLKLLEYNMEEALEEIDKFDKRKK